MHADYLIPNNSGDREAVPTILNTSKTEVKVIVDWFVEHVRCQ